EEEQNQAGNEKRYVRLVPTLARVAIEETLAIGQRDRESNASICREKQPMLPAARDGARREQEDGALQRPPEKFGGQGRRQAGRGARAVGGSDVRLLDDAARVAAPGEVVGHSRCRKHNQQRSQGARGQRSEGRMYGAIQFLKEPKKPVGRQPTQKALIFRR